MIALRGMSSTDSIMPARNSRSAGLHGANVTPQLPISAVVTPCQLIGVRSGSQPTCASRCVCRSMKPGETVRPLASISSLPLDAILPTSAIIPSLMAMSPLNASPPVPSTMLPPRITMSCVMESPRPECFCWRECRRFTEARKRKRPHCRNGNEGVGFGGCEAASSIQGPEANLPRAIFPATR